MRNLSASRRVFGEASSLLGGECLKKGDLSHEKPPTSQRRLCIGLLAT